VERERISQLVERCLVFHWKARDELPEATSRLQAMGITTPGLTERHGIGYSDNRLARVLPRKGALRQELTDLGMLDNDGQDRLKGCLVFPLYTLDRVPVGFVGLPPAPGAGLILVPHPPLLGLWNLPAARGRSELLVTSSIAEALSLEVAGFENVAALIGETGLTTEEIANLTGEGLVKLILAGVKNSAARLLSSQFKCEALRIGDVNLNTYLLDHTPEKLAELITHTDRHPLRSGTAPVPAPPAPREEVVPINEDSFAATFSTRNYQIAGLSRRGGSLHATVKLDQGGKFHVDTLPLYHANARRVFCQDAGRVFGLPADVVEADLSRVIRICEAYNPAQAALPGGAVQRMTAAEKDEAMAFGKSPDLMQRIVADYSKCGLIGEDSNKLLCYIASVSRLLPAPICVLIIASSGGGKTALQNATLMFCPDEDVLRLTALTGKSLFYKERLSLKHKVLAIEEGEGAADATYAIRNLITAQVISIEAAVRDVLTGRLTTMTNRVEGPVAVFMTTTNPEVAPETRNRFFVLGIDESAEQTDRILAFQRRRETMAGLVHDQEVQAIVRRHHNFQRLLRLLPVVNPFAEKLAYGDHRLQARRDQPKYLNLIKAIALLRQMQKAIKTDARNGTTVEYIEVDAEDIRIANTLAAALFGRNLDELSVPGRNLLDVVRNLAVDRLRGVQEGASVAEVTFTRRDVREFSGWSNYRTFIHLKELVDFEYLVIDSGTRSSGYRYRLADELPPPGEENGFPGLVSGECLAAAAGH